MPTRYAATGEMAIGRHGRPVALELDRAERIEAPNKEIGGIRFVDKGDAVGRDRPLWKIKGKPTCGEISQGVVRFRRNRRKYDVKGL